MECRKGTGLVEIKACARDPGDPAKIAVLAHDTRTDHWRMHRLRGRACRPFPRTMASAWTSAGNDSAANSHQCQAPAEVQSSSSQEKHSMDLAVAEDRLAQAIGKGGQNVRLASRLTGWQLNVMTQDQVSAKSEAEQAVARQLFVDKLEVDEEIAMILVAEGFNTVEEIAYVPVGELLAVEGFDEDIVEECGRARALMRCSTTPWPRKRTDENRRRKICWRWKVWTMKPPMRWPATACGPARTCPTWEPTKSSSSASMGWTRIAPRH